MLFDKKLKKGFKHATLIYRVNKLLCDLIDILIFFLLELFYICLLIIKTKIYTFI